MILTRKSKLELETETSPASRAPLIKMGLVSQGPQNLALGLAKAAASQLAEVVRSHPRLFGQGRPVIKTLLSVAVILLSQIFLLSPLAAQTPRPLQLTAEVIEQRYCSIKPDKITLQLKLRVRYSNLGAERLIIYQGHDLFYQIKVRSDAASGAQPYEVLLLNMHYFDEEFERIDASSPGRVFEKLAPKESFERELITGLGVTDHDKERSSTAVRPGRHTVHVIVSTWYQTPQLAVKLREQWQRKGVLWTQPLTSVPVSLVIEKPAAAPPCR